MQYAVLSTQYSVLSTASARSIAQAANGCQGIPDAQAVELMAAMVRRGHAAERRSGTWAETVTLI